jgi:hypothetical protein
MVVRNPADPSVTAGAGRRKVGGMATIEHESQTEPDPVFFWRVEALERAGYPSLDAWELAAAPEVDLRFAERLLAKGCPPSTAARILL